MNPERKVIIRTLTIDDVLHGVGHIDVMGVRFDSHVTVTIRQSGSEDMDIVDSEDRTLYVSIPAVAFPIKVDKEVFKNDHKMLYEAFIKAVDKRALAIAAVTPDSKWDYDEVEDDES